MLCPKQLLQEKLHIDIFKVGNITISYSFSLNDNISLSKTKGLHQLDLLVPIFGI